MQNIKMVNSKMEYELIKNIILLCLFAVTLVIFAKQLTKLTKATGIGREKAK